MRPSVERQLARLMEYLPVTLTSGIGAFFGQREVLKEVQKGRRWVSCFYESLEQIGGITQDEEKRRRLIEFGRQVGRVYAEFTILQRIDRQGRIAIEGLEHLEGRTQPTIFVAPHLSNWEAAFKLFGVLDNPTCQLYEPRESEQRMAIANRCRRAWGEHIHLISTREPMAMKKIQQMLDSNINMYILPDEEKDDYVHAPSLGRQIPYSGNRWMISRLAVKYQLDVIPLYVERVAPVNFRIQVDAKIRPDAELDAVSAAQQVADQIDARFDQWVRQRPEHWYWLSYLDLGKTLEKTTGTSKAATK